MDVVAEDRFAEDLDHVQAAPADQGLIELVVRRPAEGEREILDEGQLDLQLGLVGDRWAGRDHTTPSYMLAQLTLISTRVLAAIEPDRARWPIAGDQIYVDFDLSEANLPPGSRLAIGSAVVEVTPEPHTGCAKFSARFGSDALRWINSPVGRAHRMRGMNTRIVQAGSVKPGDSIRKI